MSRATQTPGICQTCGDEHPPVSKRSQKVARCHCRGVIVFPNREPSVKRRRVFMFKQQFAGLVESWEKLQTVRPTPKRMPRVGDIADLRVWTGLPYRSKQRVLLEAPVVEVFPICFDGKVIKSNGVQIEDAEGFARADGFENLKAMAEWFESTHGPLPFVGIVVKWEPINAEIHEK